MQDSGTKKSIEKFKESLTILNSNSVQNRQVLSILNIVKNLESKALHKINNENVFDRLSIGRKAR